MIKYVGNTRCWLVSDAGAETLRTRKLRSVYC